VSPQGCHSRGSPAQGARSSLQAFWRFRQVINRVLSKKSARGARALFPKPAQYRKLG
jgi:hypothetical protein